MTNSTLSARGFTAWITIDGEPLPVYQANTADATCSAWIPSRAGQAFSVWWKDDSKARIATSGHVFVDGHDIASAISRPGRTKPVERAGAKSSARRLRPFRFSVLRLTDDDTIASQDDATLSDMGTIKIEISRVRLGDEVPFKGYEAQDRGLVHERAKKLGAHCTSYGPSTRTPASRTVAVSTAPYDPDMPGPYVTFIFRYKSEDILRADGVISNGERKRSSPAPDDEVIEISGSESEKEASNGPAKKRARTEEGKPPSEAPSRAEQASSKPPEAMDVSDRPDIMAKAASGLPENSDNVSEPPHDNEEMASSELGLGTPALLQSEPENSAASQAAEGSQTQADDTQMGFSAPPTLLRDDVEQVKEGATDSNAQPSEVEGDAEEHHAEESPLENETQLSEAS